MNGSNRTIYVAFATKDSHPLGIMIRENMQGLIYGSFAPLYPALGIAAITISMNLLVDWYLQTIGASLPEEL